MLRSRLINPTFQSIVRKMRESEPRNVVRSSGLRQRNCKTIRLKTLFKVSKRHINEIILNALNIYIFFRNSFFYHLSYCECYFGILYKQRVEKGNFYSQLWFNKRYFSLVSSLISNIDPSIRIRTACCFIRDNNFLIRFKFDLAKDIFPAHLYGEPASSLKLEQWFNSFVCQTWYLVSNYSYRERDSRITVYTYRLDYFEM